MKNSKTILQPSSRFRTHAIVRIAAAIALASLLIPTVSPILHAVPSTILGDTIVPFVNVAGARLEDFANRDAMWQQDAELKGDWEDWKDPAVKDSAVEVLHLRNSAVVFGLTASEVTLQRRDNRPTQIQVKFTTAEEKSPGKTREQLLANIAAWSGSPMAMTGSVGQLDHEKISLRLSASDDDSLLLTFAAAIPKDS